MATLTRAVSCGLGCPPMLLTLPVTLTPISADRESVMCEVGVDIDALKSIVEAHCDAWHPRGTLGHD